MRDEVLEGNDMFINGVPATVWNQMSEEERKAQFEKVRREIEKTRSGK